MTALVTSTSVLISCDGVRQGQRCQRTTHVSAAAWDTNGAAATLRARGWKSQGSDQPRVFRRHFCPRCQP